MKSVKKNFVYLKEELTYKCPKCKGTMYHMNFDYYVCEECGYGEAMY